jgi:cytochrome c553
MLKQEIDVSKHGYKFAVGRLAFALLISTAASTLPFARAQAQAPTRPASAPARGTVAPPRAPIEANLAQLMRGIFFPNSNVIFAAQGDNPNDVPPAKDPATATNPLASTYGKWQAVENSGLAIAEAATLLTLPGRKCSNGLDIPLKNPDWAKFVQGLRDAGMTAYKAAQSKNQDNILNAADVLTTACADCHDKYREKTNLADRCK